MTWIERTDGWWFEGTALRVRVDPATGAIDRLVQTGDPELMNWVASSANGWHPRSNGWGLGLIEGSSPVRWQDGALSLDEDTLTARYDCRGWAVTVRRRPEGDGLDEQITVRNTDDREQEAGSIWIYTPFNVDLIAGAADLRQRCHAHVWAGGRETWIKAVRWSGEGRPVTLRGHTGHFLAYGLDATTEYAGSPVRGDICLMTGGQRFEPGAEVTFGWHLSTAELSLPPHAERYVLTVGESTRVHDEVFTATSPGVVTLTKDDTVTNLVVVPPLEELLTVRTRFIHERQQVTEPESPQFGALLPYDNRYDAMLRHPERADFNDGRERVGMGVLLAQRRRTHPSPELVAATDRYAHFVATRLQSPSGQVFDSSTDQRARLYNYPWVCRFWLEMYAATGRDEHADRFLATTRAFYAAGGAEFYPIGVPILRAHELLGGTYFDASIDFIRARGADYPTHEVPYEQTIVGPAATMLLETHLVTGDPTYRREAAPHLKLLEQFGGSQPDGRLHDVPVRHWDGYWFGARERWGDVMPHHWAAVTAWAWALRATADDDEHWRERATRLSLATLHNFTADGRASAAFVYPAMVNGSREHRFDPLANDQDWALVTAQDIHALG